MVSLHLSPVLSAMFVVVKVHVVVLGWVKVELVVSGAEEEDVLTAVLVLVHSLAGQVDVEVDVFDWYVDWLCVVWWVHWWIWFHNLWVEGTYKILVYFTCVIDRI